MYNIHQLSVFAYKIFLFFKPYNKTKDYKQ